MNRQRRTAILPLLLVGAVGCGMVLLAVTLVRSQASPYPLARSSPPFGADSAWLRSFGQHAASGADARSRWAGILLDQLLHNGVFGAMGLLMDE